MTAHISESTRTEIPPSPPVPGSICRMVGAPVGWSQEEVPVKCLRNLNFLGRPFKSLWPDWPICPGMGLPDLPYRATPDIFSYLPYIVIGMSFYAHLGCDFVFLCGKGKLAGLPDRVGQRLLNIDMFTCLHGLQCRQCVGMIRSGNHAGIDILLFIEHLAVIFPFFCFWICFEYFGSIIPVYITEGHNILAHHVPKVHCAFSTDPYTGDIQFITGRDVTQPAYHMTRKDC